MMPYMFGRRGANPGYVVNNLKGDARELHDNLYCARGDMENRIKEQQLSAPGSVCQGCCPTCSGIKVDRSAAPAR